MDGASRRRESVVGVAEARGGASVAAAFDAASAHVFRVRTTLTTSVRADGRNAEACIEAKAKLRRDAIMDALVADRALIDQEGARQRGAVDRAFAGARQKALDTGAAKADDALGLGRSFSHRYAGHRAADGALGDGGNYHRERQAARSAAATALAEAAAAGIRDLGGELAAALLVEKIQVIAVLEARVAAAHAMVEAAADRALREGEAARTAALHTLTEGQAKVDTLLSAQHRWRSAQLAADGRACDAAIAATAEVAGTGVHSQRTAERRRLGQALAQRLGRAPAESVAASAAESRTGLAHTARRVMEQQAHLARGLAQDSAASYSRAAMDVGARVSVIVAGVHGHFMTALEGSETRWRDAVAHAVGSLRADGEALTERMLGPHLQITQEAFAAQLDRCLGEISYKIPIAAEKAADGVQTATQPLASAAASVAAAVIGTVAIGALTASGVGLVAGLFAAACVGAATAGAKQLGVDAINGKMSSWQTYAGEMGVGALGGVLQYATGTYGAKWGEELSGVAKKAMEALATPVGAALKDGAVEFGGEALKAAVDPTKDFDAGAAATAAMGAMLGGAVGAGMGQPVKGATQAASDAGAALAAGQKAAGPVSDAVGSGVGEAVKLGAVATRAPAAQEPRGVRQ